MTREHGVLVVVVGVVTTQDGDPGMLFSDVVSFRKVI